MKVLITGVCGYIGKQLAWYMKNEKPNWEIYGYDVFHKIKEIKEGHSKLSQLLFSEYTKDDFDSMPKFDIVIHMAGTSSVPAFHDFPESRYMNTMTLNNMILANVEFNYMIFTSTACAPHNWYGISKRHSEEFLKQSLGSTRLKTLRLHNVAGCIVESGFVEDHEPETHIIPNLVLKDVLDVYGDGTVARDYVHVFDVCRAITNYANYLMEGYNGPKDTQELGTGVATSVMELIHRYGDITGTPKTIRLLPAREGDARIQKADYPWFTDPADRMMGINQIIKDTIEGYEKAGRI